MDKRLISGLCTVVLLTPMIVCVAQIELDPDPPRPKKKDLWPQVDRKLGQVSFDAVVAKPDYALEYLLCTTYSKEHESVLATDVTPSKLHASLMMLGLDSGIPGYYQGDKYVPARGGKLTIEFQWVDKEGKTHKANAADWLEPTDKKTDGVKSDKWVFVGSDLSPDRRYIADVSGGIISVVNLPHAVIEVPFQSTAALKRRHFVISRTAVPPSGTKVKVIITPDKDASKAAAARATLDIDRFGRMVIDGTSLTMDQLEKWALGFSEKHSDAMVVIRLAPFAVGCYAPQARLELKLGGIYNFEIRQLDDNYEMLPSTPEQLQKVVEKWQQRCEKPEDEIQPIDFQAEEMIKRVRMRRDDYRKYDAVLAEYEKILKGILDKHRDSNKNKPPADSR